MDKYIHNISGETKAYVGTEILQGAFLLIPFEKDSAYKNNEKLIIAISNGYAKMSRDGINDIEDINDALDFLKGNNVTVISQPQLSPFADKHVGDKSLFKRVHGILQDCVVGNNDFYFTIPYAAAKLNVIEIIGGEIGDTADFFVLDTAAGTVSTIPNYPLNQFAFDIVISKDYYEKHSEYDADVFTGLQLYCRVTSLSAKKIGVNFILNEAK